MCITCVSKLQDFARARDLDTKQASDVLNMGESVSEMLSKF